MKVRTALASTLEDGAGGGCIDVRCDVRCAIMCVPPAESKPASIYTLLLLQTSNFEILGFGRLDSLLLICHILFFGSTPTDVYYNYGTANE